MPQNIFGNMIVKGGEKQTTLNFSNARYKTNAQWQQMSDAQKKGVVVVEDYPISDDYYASADEISYNNGSVEDALDRLLASYIITLPTTGYTSGTVTVWGESLTLYSITISADKDGNPLTNFTSGMTEDYPINVSGSQTDFNKLYAFSIGNGNVTFYLTSAPSTAFNVLIKEAI